jgi:hypothetical protein
MDHPPQTDPLKRLAEAISWIFHPFTIVIPTMLILMRQQAVSFWPSVFWTFLSIGVANLPMAVLLIDGIRSGRFSDLSVSIREQRKSIYTVYSISTASLLMVLIWGQAPLILTACLSAVMITTMLGFAINHFFTKLSIHAIVMGGCATALMIVAPRIGMVMILFTVVVAWARIRLKHHTLGQILIGWALPTLTVLLIFPLFHLFP